MVRSQPRWPQQSRSRLIDGLVDALVTQPHPRLGGEPHPQMTADLLRAPPLVQKLRDHLSEFAVDLNPSPMIAGATRRRRNGAHRTDGNPDFWSRCRNDIVVDPVGHVLLGARVRI